MSSVDAINSFEFLGKNVGLECKYACLFVVLF